MAGEIDLTTRAGVAAYYMHETLRDYNPYVKYDMKAGEFIMRIASGFESIPLADVIPDETTDIPCHWRFLLPTDAVENPLALIEFGHTGPDVIMLDTDDGRGVYRNTINAELTRERERKVPVRQLHERVGAEMTRHVSFAGDILFAGIERRYRLGPEGGVVASWSQLIYSRKLLRTRQALQRHAYDLNVRRTPETWINEALGGQQPDVRIAHLMALSALALTIED